VVTAFRPWAGWFPHPRLFRLLPVVSADEVWRADTLRSVRIGRGWHVRRISIAIDEPDLGIVAWQGYGGAPERDLGKSSGEVTQKSRLRNGDVTKRHASACRKTHLRRP